MWIKSNPFDIGQATYLSLNELGTFPDNYQIAK